MAFEADYSQQIVIEAQEGEHLVLAPPGCGKTQILTERIRYAHDKCGVGYADMLCLTFTNRAARNMRERIGSSMTEQTNATTKDLYVGSIHRFCSRFLFDNAVVPADAGMIDDDDILSICARFENEDEGFVAANFKRRKEYFDAVHLSAMMYQIEQGHPKELRVHPECLNADDLFALRTICQHQQMAFTASAMMDIYRHADTYRTIVQSSAYDYGEQKAIMPLLRKMELACFYERYKRDNRLMDFEDLLLYTYTTVSKPDGGEYRKYSWVQVDEVQDLNPLQLAIVDGFTRAEEGKTLCVCFLGDEQQAIFSFMGAKLSTLDMLRKRCGNNLHYLSVNHRSPDYLMNVFNTYADSVLNIDKSLLPASDFSPRRNGNELAVMTANTQDVEYSDAAQQAMRLCEQNENETTAIVVLSNNDADAIGERLTSLGAQYFKVSGTDMFSLPEVKLLIAHLTVLENEHNFISWTRILKGMHVYEQSASARRFVKELFDMALTPSDLLLFPESSYLMQFADLYRDREIVVFDTETTGLDTENDDIVQIAAMKMRGGALVPGSDYCVYIHTDREIPLMLGDIENPIIEEMKHHKLLSHEDALRQFLDYAEGCVLLGHNARFDYTILDANIKRYLSEKDLQSLHPVYLDSLKLVRLLFPQLRQHKLKYLLEVLHLEGENSHLADADVAATCNVVKYCYDRALEVIEEQKAFLQNKSVREHARVFRQNYLHYFNEVKDMRVFYNLLIEDRVIIPVKNIEYIFRYIDKEKPTVLELSTLKESDLCSSDVIDERIFVTTVHKAKGLEFDNVVVFDVCDDRYPSFFAQENPQQQAEDARKLYVAMTRARKRLLITLSAVRHDYRNVPHDRKTSRFLTPILHYFTSVVIE